MKTPPPKKKKVLRSFATEQVKGLTQGHQCCHCFRGVTWGLHEWVTS